MNATMNSPQENKIVSRPLRYIAIVGGSAKSCRKLKLLMKGTSYYCLVDCYTNSSKLIHKETFYIPDCVVLEVRSLFSMYFISKRAAKIKEAFPGIKLIIYYNMVKRYPRLEQRNNEYPGFYFTDEESVQVGRIENELHIKLV